MVIGRQGGLILAGMCGMACPAAGPAPTVRCEAEAEVRGWRRQGQHPHPGDRRAACSSAESLHSAVNHPAPDEGAKYAQEPAHESPEWHDIYATLRNSNEGMNGFIKDGAREAVDDPERRRIRGIAAQSVLVAFQLFAANLRKIGEFLAHLAAEGKKIRKLPSRRRIRSLPTWAPQAPAAGVTGEATDDPEPPLTA